MNKSLFKQKQQQQQQTENPERNAHAYDVVHVHLAVVLLHYGLHCVLATLQDVAVVVLQAVVVEV